MSENNKKNSTDKEKTNKFEESDEINELKKFEYKLSLIGKCSKGDD